MIREVIVVEGKDDISAVKKAVDAEVISTSGFGYGKKLISLLKDLEERRGIIIFTDPDYMGKKIRKDISSHLRNPKQAFLPKDKALKGSNVGVENATSEDIKIAIEKARPTIANRENEFSKLDLIKHGLSGTNGANEKRNKVSKILRIGHGNAKQFLNKLNGFGITKEEFLEALKEVDNGKTL